MAYVERKKIVVRDWRTFTGEPERDGLINAMRAIEAREGERLGWDKPARLYTVHLHDIDSGAVELRPIPGVVWRCGRDNPADDLMTLAYRLPPPPRDLPSMRFADAPDGIAAVAFMTEGWGANLDELSAEQLARNAAGQRVIHEMATRVEIRAITAVDINGYGYHVMRFRGQELRDEPTLFEPEQMWADGGDGPGQLVRTLYCLAVAARVHGWPWRAA